MGECCDSLAVLRRQLSSSCFWKGVIVRVAVKGFLKLVYEFYIKSGLELVSMLRYGDNTESVRWPKESRSLDFYLLHFSFGMYIGLWAT